MYTNHTRSQTSTIVRRAAKVTNNYYGAVSKFEKFYIRKCSRILLITCGHVMHTALSYIYTDLAITSHNHYYDVEGQGCSFHEI